MLVVSERLIETVKPGCHRSRLISDDCQLVDDPLANWQPMELLT